MPQHDFQQDMAHIARLSEVAKMCVKMSVECADAGDGKRAQEWTDEAQRFLAQAVKLYRKYKRRNPHEDK